MNVIVRQGQHVKLKCLEKYNTSGDVVIFSWLLNWMLWKYNTNMLVLKNINPEMSGEYICKAQNRAGIYYDAVNITVAGKCISHCTINLIQLFFIKKKRYSFLYCS